MSDRITNEDLLRLKQLSEDVGAPDWTRGGATPAGAHEMWDAVFHDDRDVVAYFGRRAEDADFVFEMARVCVTVAKELIERREEVQRLQMRILAAVEEEKLEQWADDPKRLIPAEAFSPGVTRDAASAFYGVVWERDQLREKMNTQYWNRVRDENTALRKKVKRLESRGIEDLQYTNDKYKNGLQRIQAVAATYAERDKDVSTCGRDIEGIARETLEE